jgi:hypothetical protein
MKGLKKIYQPKNFEVWTPHGSEVSLFENFLFSSAFHSVILEKKNTEKGITSDCERALN